MTAVLEGLSPELAAEICRSLWRLAKNEDEFADAETASTPYWRPASPLVLGHRAAARALRAAAERFETGALPDSLAS